MKTLLYKQSRLLAHPMTFGFAFSGALLLIPNYPYSIAFFYTTLGLFFMFQNAREQRDHVFSAMLPVRKSDIVRGAVAFTVIIQIANIAIAAGFALLSNAVAPGRNNYAGIDANPALLGIGFLLYAVFNGVFLPSFYKNGYKAGVACLKASFAIVPVVILDLIFSHLVPWVDGKDPRQFFVLVAGAAIYCIVTKLAAVRSVALYEKVDL